MKRPRPWLVTVAQIWRRGRFSSSLPLGSSPSSPASHRRRVASSSPPWLPASSSSFPLGRNNGSSMDGGCHDDDDGYHDDDAWAPPIPSPLPPGDRGVGFGRRWPPRAVFAAMATSGGYGYGGLQHRF
ncbi:Os04g0287750 [Oryza sativa Japonica Group]|uniref:Os04g0287750 protein n=1 Tax=Oryza sativa subsp. japonica TaxID=39947 RepID=A0A0P0W887_ORYSJ|nr:Os04g0287750 [Oryza sativa Japonica Group]